MASRNILNAENSEKYIDKYLRERVKKLGGWSIKMDTTFVAGLPDRLLLFPGGRFCFAEIKTKGQKPRRIQLYIHKKLRNLGFPVYVVDSIEIVNKIIEEYEQG